MSDEEFAEKDSMALSESELPKLRSYQPVQLLFLTRLSRLLRIRNHSSGTAESAEWLERLLSKAVYSTYRDCVALGVGEDARTLFTKITSDRRRQ